jgi:hypothetical protein
VREPDTPGLAGIVGALAALEAAKLLTASSERPARCLEFDASSGEVRGMTSTGCEHCTTSGARLEEASA